MEENCCEMCLLVPFHELLKDFSSCTSFCLHQYSRTTILSLDFPFYSWLPINLPNLLLQVSKTPIVGNFQGNPHFSVQILFSTQQVTSLQVEAIFSFTGCRRLLQLFKWAIRLIHWLQQVQFTSSTFCGS